MKNWKSWIVPLWFALGVVLLILAVVKPLTRGEPINYGVLYLGVLNLTMAVVFGRKSGGSSGPPSA